METHTPVLERVPITPLPPLSERERIRIAAVTAIAEVQLGADLEITEEDETLARQIVQDGRLPTRAEMTRPGAILKLEALLSEYDHEVVEDARRLRTYVTNRLLEESTGANAKDRLRALEMLGKISDVGLFTERSEVVITNRSEKDLESELRESLAALLDPRNVIDVTETPARSGQTPVFEAEVEEIDDVLKGY